MIRLFRLRLQRLHSNLIHPWILLGILWLLLFSAAAGAEDPASASIGSVLEHANTLYSEKKYDEARREYERVLEIDKGSVSAWRSLGWCDWALGQRARAYQVWGDLIKAFPDDLQTLIALSKASEQDQRWNEAADYYAKVLELEPENQPARLGRARIFIAQHKFQLAEQESRAALINTPSDKNVQSLLADALMGQGRYPEAEGLLRTLAKAEPAPRHLSRLAKTLAELGKYEQAAEVYKTSFGIQADADVLTAWRGLGASLRKTGQNPRAYAIWQGILHVAPSDLQTLLAIGRASEQDKLWQQGLDYYALALQKAPGDHAAHLGRAKIFFAKQDYKAAESELKAILDRSPSDMEARAAMVEVLISMNRGAEAEQMLEPLVKLDPVPRKLNRLGTILNDLRRDEEAADYFQKSLQLDPENEVAILGVVYAYWNQHKFKESIKLLQGYLAKHPDNDVVRTELAAHASADDNWDLAAPEWKFLIAKHPEEVKFKLKLAQLLHRAGTGGNEEFIKIANEVLAKDPNNENALSLLAEDATFSGNLENAVFWTNRLVTAAPTLDRLVRLGKLRMALGESLSKEGKLEVANIQYRFAMEAFQRANELDPIKSMAPVDMIQDLLVMEQPAEAVKMGQKLYTKYPTSADAIKQLAAAYRDRGDYADALDILKHVNVYYPNSSALNQSIADLTYHAGNKERAFKMLNETLNAPHRQVIPILLYHGITVGDRQDTTSLQKFRDQLLALKQEGYQSITMAQLQRYFDGKEALPAKPILITFDDARADSFKYGDPVLAETGYRATMFVPVEDVATHGPYAGVWPTIRQMYANGRWEMQCHGSNAQHWVQVDAKGHLGHFLANKMWITDAARLETDKEFATRLEQDMLNCKKTVARELPDAHIFAFAFPYGDQGHRSLSNAPNAYKINQGLVKKHFGLAFNVDNSYLATEDTPRFVLPRFEVPRTYSGKDLVQQLKVIDPIHSTNSKLAHLDVESGRYGQGLEILSGLVKEGVADEAELLTTSGKVLNWTGDHAGSRKQLEKARALRPGDPVIQTEIDKLNRRLGPAVQMNAVYFQDNAHRTFYSLSPSALFSVSDAFSWSAYYRYLDFDQKVDAHRLGTVGPEQHYQAIGNQFGGQFSYELAPRSLLSMSAGFADFSGDASPRPSGSGKTFPLGSIQFTKGVGDRLDLKLGADHTFVNTAGAILNNIAFSRVEGEFKLKLLDSLRLTAGSTYFNYTDDNQRVRTEVELDQTVWDDPNITVGAQFIRDDTEKNNPLFWTPNNYLAFSAPLKLKKRWGESLVAELDLVPGMGKETGNDYQFQIGGYGSVNYIVNDDVSLNLSLNRYQAATYSNFSAYAGVLLRY